MHKTDGSIQIERFYVLEVFYLLKMHFQERKPSGHYNNYYFVLVCDHNKIPFIMCKNMVCECVFSVLLKGTFHKAGNVSKKRVGGSCGCSFPWMRL